MATYKVGTNSAGDRVWWAGYNMAGSDMSPYSCIRDATDEEAPLMEKVVWQTDNFFDCQKLKQLIARDSPNPPRKADVERDR